MSPSATKARSGNSIDRIPDEILSEGILNKLPLTSQCTCKCVSKLWNSLIMQNYHQSQRLPIICKIGLRTNSLRLCSVDSNTGAVTPIYTPIDLGPLIQPICSNGFICFRNTMDRQNFVVFNPATQEKILVPNDPNIYDTHYFGFDPCSNQFKVIRGKFYAVQYPHCQVYTLGTGSWRNVTSTPVQGSGRKCSLFYCFNGIIYWYSDTGMINFFHLGTENFGMIQGPNSETPVKTAPYMFDLEGCLCLGVVRCAPHSSEIYNILDLWMLKGQYNLNSGWILIASVNIPLEMGKKIVWMRPYLIRSGELLLAKCSQQGSQSFYAYSLLTRQFQNIKVCGQDRYYNVNNFRENLASLKDL